MSKNILEVPFWKVVLRFSISFLILLTLVLSIATYFKNGNFNTISESFKDGSWIEFTLIRVALAIGYGIFMAKMSIKRAKNNTRR